jgi:solute:Na+ symporter, SSS family
LIFAFIVIGASFRFKSESSYLLAERKTGFFSLTATLVMTELNTATLISFASLGYIAGFWSLVLPFIFLIGLLFYAATVAKKWKAFNGLSVAAFFSKRYGTGLGKFVSITLLIAMSGFSATYVKSLVLLFSPLFQNFSEWQLSAILISLILLMTLRAGLISIIYTDIVSFIITVLFFPLMALFSANSVSFSLDTTALVTDIAQGMQILSPRFVYSLIILTMFTYILAPWYGQKIFSARSERVAYLSVVAAAAIIFCLYGLAVFSSSLLHMSGCTLHNPEFALPYILHNVLPKGLCGLGYGILFAASATTLTGVWNAMTSMLVGDYLTAPGQEKHKRTIFITVACACLSYILSNIFVDKIFNMMILANIPVAALSFALLAGFYWERTSRFGAYLSIVAGLGWGIFTYLWFGEDGVYTWYWAIGGIPLIFASGIVGSYSVPDTQTLQFKTEV